MGSTAIVEEIPIMIELDAPSEVKDTVAADESVGVDVSVAGVDSADPLGTTDGTDGR